MRKDIPLRQSDIERWIAEYCSKAFICRELHCKEATLNEYSAKMGLSYAGNKSSKGKNSPARKSARDFLHRGSLIKSYKLKLKLLEDGVKERRCERCGGREWFGELIPIELHHINGDRFDNRLENIQLLCPNCHSLTANNAGKGIRRKTSSIAGVV